MSKSVLSSLQAPGRALVFICEKCGKRVGDSTRHASDELARSLKHAARREFGKHQVRIALTSCMDVCPEDAISVLLQPLDPGRKSVLLQADAHDPDASSEALIQRLRNVRQGV
jgi:predicted metal-binding protein